MKVATAAYNLDWLDSWAQYEDKLARWVSDAAGPVFCGCDRRGVAGPGGGPAVGPLGGNGRGTQFLGVGRHLANRALNHSTAIFFTKGNEENEAIPPLD